MVPNTTRLTRRRRLRRHSNRAERLIWHYLRGRRLGGLRFRRQHSVGPFIVDFFCAEKKLIVELDGESHGPERYDADQRREAYLKDHGLTVVRFVNEDVYAHLRGVLEEIYRVATGKELVWAYGLPARDPERRPIVLTPFPSPPKPGEGDA